MMMHAVFHQVGKTADVAGGVQVAKLALKHR